MRRWQASLAVIAALLAGSVAQAQTTAQRTAAIASIRSASGASFSPDGRQVVYISNASGSPQVWIAPVSGGEPRQVTRLSDPVQSVAWSPAGERIAYDVAPGGGLNVQVYVAKTDGSEPKLVTAGGEVNNRMMGWTRDGRWLQIATNRFNPTEMDAFLLDPATGQTKAVGTGKGLDTITDVSRDGRLALISRLASRGDNNLLLVDLDTGAETLLTAHKPPAQFAWGEFSADGRRVFALSDVATDLAAFGVIELDAAGKPGPFKVLAKRADAEADNASLSDDGASAVLRWNVAGRSELSYLDTVTGKVTTGPKLPGDLIGGPLFSKDGRQLVLSLTSAAAPTDVWTTDVATAKSVQLTRSAHDGVDLATLVRPTLVNYKAHDGLALSGWLYRPKDAKGPGPVVFIYHGGPEGQSRPSLSTDVQALVGRGISVFLPNVRGSTGFGKRFVNLDNGPLRVDGVKDIKASTDALVALGVADPRRLGIMGGSYGGYMVMAGVTEYPDMFAAGANLYGVVNFDTFFKHTQPWMAAISTIEYGNPATQAEMLKSLSPINKLDRIKTPLIVLHGANDTNVPVIEAEQIVQQLKARGVPVEYVLFPDEGHGWRRLPNRIKSTVTLADFFERKLRPPPAAD
ncbi:MAG: S9 family peptidase [Alphaproteobacteria bacterium]|nr:S9 family peptidase [Alphaproteobacteria bacterium]MBU1516194.1 S9 family peptidase [Alphaproteobacteria bacterium]MBU2093504.1 S9 family peptidase [Alphaproteobacteria bacterium]MBU2152352.1 S9 family peptidase [Alphaproteobacteria bacterium]MBU2308166.1 S9 family peptidase [Alphaproteobacteria bacterium]